MSASVTTALAAYAPWSFTVFIAETKPNVMNSIT
jgi:hypothetical protein